MVHFLLFFGDWQGKMGEPLYLNGTLALACGLTIYITSINYIRRKLFNLFFFAHYSFVGYFLFAYLHVPECRPFLLVGTALYALDRVLRVLWTGAPRRTQVFVAKGDNMAQVRFPKNVLTQALAKHTVGQYYFVNFPGLSLHEWHPFSVSSGPREDSVELHIRALGDHTTKIVAHAKKCQAKDTHAWIRYDGPYGKMEFEFRRYPVCVLVGGGVGITPVLGMLKDVYNYGRLAQAQQRTTIPHRIQTVYCIWVVPTMKDAHGFLPELKAIMKNSALPQMPRLVLWLHVTRAKPEELEHPCLGGRPKLPQLFDQVQREHGKAPTLVFACGPAVMVNELWDLSVQRNKIRGAHVDFHKENFEF